MYRTCTSRLIGLIVMISTTSWAQDFPNLPTEKHPGLLFAQEQIADLKERIKREKKREKRAAQRLKLLAESGLGPNAVKGRKRRGSGQFVAPSPNISGGSIFFGKMLRAGKLHAKLIFGLDPPVIFFFFGYI